MAAFRHIGDLLGRVYERNLRDFQY